MRIVFCWSNPSGYMAACWRAISRRSGVEVHVLAWRPQQGGGQSAFESKVLEGVSTRFLNPDEREDAPLIADEVADWKPDVVVIGGWRNFAYRRLVDDPRLARCAFVMGMDTPWRDNLRQHIARLVLRRFILSLDLVFVPGERAYQYAIRLGMPEQRVARGLYGIDYDAFARAAEQRAASPWPRRFLFAGRYHPIKGLDLLLRAYSQYRRQVTDPWGLGCCGTGPLAEDIARCEGVENYGFVQPTDQPKLFSRHGAFVLASREDPWPLVLSEASAAGLPILCSNACGSAVELVRPLYSGQFFSTGNVDDLVRQLLWVHHNVARLPAMGQRAQQAAAAYAADVWADRWEARLNELLQHAPVRCHRT